MENRIREGDFVGYNKDALKKARVPTSDPAWKTTGCVEKVDGKFVEVEWSGPNALAMLSRVPVADLEVRYSPTRVRTGNDTR